MGRKKKISIRNLVIQEITIGIQRVNKTHNLKCCCLGSYTAATRIRRSLLHQGRLNFNYMFTSTYWRSLARKPSEGYTCYSFKLGNSRTDARIAHITPPHVLASTHLTIDRLLMKLLIQLLRIKPSGLFQFRNNHWNYEPLEYLA